MIRKTRIKVSHRVLARTLRLLMHGDVTAKQLHTETGVHLVTAQEWLRTLMDEGTIHIIAWLPDSLGRDATPVYALGSGENASRRRKTRAQIMREYRQRRKEQHGQL